MIKGKKTILIFGGGINQLELIREARILNIITVVIDPLDCAQGKSEADFFYQVEGDDYMKTKRIAVKHRVDGLVTGQMEKPLPLMAKLASELGLIFNSSHVIERSLNKILMKEAFVKYRIACAMGVSFSKNEDITELKLKNLVFPMIVKPVDAFSSRGVIKVNDFNEILKIEKYSRSYSSNGMLLIEEFLEGKEFSVESVTFEGITTVIQITEKFITSPPHTVEVAHLQPARITDAERLLIERIVLKAVSAVGINNSASHAEVMLTANGPYMIEIGARLGGDFISSYLTKASTGISMDRAAIQVALGIQPNLKKVFSHFSMIKYLELEKGKKVKKLNSLDLLKFEQEHVFSHYFIKEGDVIAEVKCSADRSVCILFKSDSYSKLFELIDQASLNLIESIELV
jgi:biotin carboxylase